MADQRELFGGRRELPEGFRYRPDLVTPAEEQALLRRLHELPLQAFGIKACSATS